MEAGRASYRHIDLKPASISPIVILSDDLQVHQAHARQCETLLKLVQDSETSSHSTSHNDMADAPSPIRAGSPTTVPLKRPLEDDHAPNVSSPLNPNAAASTKQPIVREKREKKDSLKKREAAGLVNTTTKGNTTEHAAKKQKLSDDAPAQPSPTRYNHPLPKELFHYNIKQSVFSSHEPEPLFTPGGVELKRPVDQYEYRVIHSNLS